MTHTTPLLTSRYYEATSDYCVPQKLHDSVLALGYKIEVIPHGSWRSFEPEFLPMIDGTQRAVQREKATYKQELTDESAQKKQIEKRFISLEVTTFNSKSLAGFLCAEFQGGSVCYVHSLGVLPEHRRKHLATHLLQYLNVMCAHHESVACIHFTWASNSTALCIADKHVLKMHSVYGYIEVKPEPFQLDTKYRLPVKHLA